jgi:hypothetical protein
LKTVDLSVPAIINLRQICRTTFDAYNSGLNVCSVAELRTVGSPLKENHFFLAAVVIFTTKDVSKLLNNWTSLGYVTYEFLITGDFSIDVDDFTDSNALKFSSLLDLAKLTQSSTSYTLRFTYTLLLLT